MTRKPDYVVNVTVDGMSYYSSHTRECSALKLANANAAVRATRTPEYAVPYRIRVFLRPLAQEKRE